MLNKFDIELPKSLTELVASRVRQAIIDGEFALGQMISEETLAESFGVSRTPVRDALTLLQATGLVEIRSKRGSFVFQPSAQDVQAICDFRVLLEVQAARRSWALDPAGIVGDLQRVFEQMLEAARADDNVAYGRCDSAFHEALFTRCGNPYLRDAYGLVSGQIAALRTNMALQFSDAREVSLAEHRSVVALIERGDFNGLDKLLTAHIGRTVEAYRLAALNGQFGTARAASAPAPRAA